MPIKLNTASGGGVILTGANTASDKTITVPAVDATMLTDSSGVLNIGSGQVYKDASGNVGIGTTSPAQRLDVQTASGNYQFRLGNTGNAAYTYDIGRNTSDGLLYFYGNQSGSNGFVFSTSNGERARIDSSGNLMVNTTTVLGPAVVNSRSTVSGTGCFGCLNTAGAGSYFIWFVNAANNATIGSISNNGNTATSYNTTSDYRLKENVQPMQGALAKVAALKPVTYIWKATGEASEGFIAHELAEVCPTAVTGEKDAVGEDGKPVYQGVDTSFLVATLTAAIQEQQQMIETLQAKVAALEAK